jgi:hypothetical protein
VMPAINLRPPVTLPRQSTDSKGPAD